MLGMMTLPATPTPCRLCGNEPLFYQEGRRFLVCCDTLSCDNEAVLSGPDLIALAERWNAAQRSGVDFAPAETYARG